jgi:hypothetical protein
VPKQASRYATRGVALPAGGAVWPAPPRQTHQRIALRAGLGGRAPLGALLRAAGWPMAGRAPSGTALFQHPSALQGFQVAKLAGEGKFRISKSGGIGSFLAICFMKKAMPEAAH